MRVIKDNLWSFTAPECSDTIFNAFDDEGVEYIITHGSDTGFCDSTEKEIGDKVVICCYMQQVSKTGIKVLDSSISVEVGLDYTGVRELKPIYTNDDGTVEMYAAHQYYVYID